MTTTIHPVLTVAILLTYLPLLVGRLSQRCHLSRIDEVLKRGDFMINLHMRSQIPSSSVYTTFGACDSLNPLSGKILHHDSVPVIVHRGLRDPPFSSHQTFLREVELRQCVFCKRPLLFWFSSIRRNFGLSGSDKNSMLP